MPVTVWQVLGILFYLGCAIACWIMFLSYAIERNRQCNVSPLRAQDLWIATVFAITWPVMVPVVGYSALFMFIFSSIREDT